MRPLEVTKTLLGFPLRWIEGAKDSAVLCANPVVDVWSIDGLCLATHDKAFYEMGIAFSKFLVSGAKQDLTHASRGSPAMHP